MSKISIEELKKLSDEDLALVLYNEIIEIADIFISCENISIEHLKGLNPSLGSVAKIAKSISLKISKLINQEEWSGQRVLINAQQAVCLMEQAALGVINNNKDSLYEAISRLKGINQE